MGFRVGRSTINRIFIIQKIIEKHRENPEISTATNKSNIKSVPVWTQLTCKQKHIKWELTEEISINKGIRQGCCILPMLCNTYLNRRDYKRMKNKRLKYTSIKTTTYFLFYISTLNRNRRWSIERNRHIAKDLSEVWLKISTKKTKTKAFSGKYQFRKKLW